MYVLRVVGWLVLWPLLAAYDGVRALWWAHRSWRSVEDLHSIQTAAEEKRDVRALLRIADQVGDIWYERRSLTRRWAGFLTLVAVVGYLLAPVTYLIAAAAVGVVALVGVGAYARRAWADDVDDEEPEELVAPPWPGLDGVSRDTVPVGWDEVTGEVVSLPLTQHCMCAGIPGSGKSMLIRTVIAGAMLDSETDVILFSAKQCDDFAAIAGGAAEYGTGFRDLPRLADVLEAVVARLGDNTGRPTLVVVDEAHHALRAPDGIGDRIRVALTTIAELGRSSRTFLLIAVQRPTKRSIPPEILENCGVRIGLRVSTPAASRILFGEDAGDRGLDPHTFTEPGTALVDGIGPEPRRVRGWMLDDADAADVVARVEESAPVRRTSQAARVVSEPTLLDRVAELIESVGETWAPTSWLAARLDRKPEDLGRELGRAGVHPRPMNRPWLGEPRKTRQGVTAEDVESARKR